MGVSRGVGFIAVTGLFAAVACGDSSGPGGPSRVALLTDPRFVQYDTSDYGAEASELEFTIRSYGIAVAPVTAYDSATLAAALAQNTVFVIPEQEGAFALADSLTAGARTVLTRFVDSSGGLLIIVPDAKGRALIDTLFGHVLAGGFGDNSYPVGSAASATPFAGGPAQVWDNDGTYTVDPTSLPTGAKIIYQGASSSVVVATIPQGRGTITLLSWDWYNAEPHGSQDGGWIEVLRRALRN